MSQDACDYCQIYSKFNYGRGNMSFRAGILQGKKVQPLDLLDCGELCK